MDSVVGDIDIKPVTYVLDILDGQLRYKEVNGMPTINVKVESMVLILNLDIDGKKEQIKKVIEVGE
jgi:hypothetical protein